GTAMRQFPSGVRAGRMGRCFTARPTCPRSYRASWPKLLRGAILLGLVQWASLAWLANPACAQPRAKTGDTVRVTPDQMHQLEIAKGELCSFRLYKTAIGQRSLHEGASDGRG